MPNVTLSLDEETYRKARIIAAENDTTVSAMVRGYLQSLQAGATQRATENAELKALFAALDAIPNRPDWSAADRLTREEANERPR